MKVETMEIAQRRVGVVKQCHGCSLPDFNSTPESQPAATLGWRLRNAVNFCGYQKVKKSLLALGF